MRNILEGFSAVQRNLYALMIYLVVTVIAGIVIQITDFMIGIDELSGNIAQQQPVYMIIRGLFVVICSAIAQTHAFSRFGQQIDDRFGRVENKLHIFFLWFILNLTFELVMNWIDWESVPLWLQPWPILIMYVTLIPIGTCIMFRISSYIDNKTPNRFVISELIPGLLTILMLNGVIFFFYINMLVMIQPILWLYPTLIIIFGYFECVIFTATWHLCTCCRDIPIDSE